MADFYKFLPDLLKKEGGKVDHPSDPGGATNLGITLETWRRFGRDIDGDGDIDKQDLWKITPADTGRIYKAQYWDKLSLDSVKNQSLANIVFDHGVNAGIARAGKMLQFILNTYDAQKLVIDGQIGPKTLAVINEGDQEKLFIYFKYMRRDFYNYRCNVLAADHFCVPFFKNELRLSPSNAAKVFLKGWQNRVNSFTYKA